METYQKLMSDMFKYGITTTPRKQETIELLGYQMVFGPEEWFLDYEPLPCNFDYVKKELAWYIKGDRSDLSICEHAKIWETCVDSVNMIQSNYGYYFSQQADFIRDLLQSDPETRRAVMNINQREHNYIIARDVPCTMYFNFLLRNGELQLHVHMRSQDAVYGLRNDLPAFQMFKLWMCQLVGVKPGVVVLSVDSLHVYEKHWTAAASTVDYKNRSEMKFTDMESLSLWIAL